MGFQGFFSHFKGSTDPAGPDYRCLKYRHTPSRLIIFGCMWVAACYYLREEHMARLFEEMWRDTDIGRAIFPYRKYDTDKIIPGVGSAHVTFWNLTNPDEFLQGAKPAVEKVGPFAFDTIHRNLKATFNDNVSQILLYVKLYRDYVARKSAKLPLGLDTELYTINEPYAFFLGAAGYSEIGMTSTLVPSVIQEVLTRLAIKYDDTPESDRTFAMLSDCGASLGSACVDGSVSIYDQYNLEVPELCAWALSVGMTNASCLPPAKLSSILYTSLALFEPYPVQQQAAAVFFATLISSPATVIAQYELTLEQLMGLGGYLEYLQTEVAIPMFTQRTLMSNNGLVVKRTVRELIFGWTQSFSDDLSIGANFTHIPLYYSADNLNENLTKWWLDEQTAEATFLGLFPDGVYLDGIWTGNGGNIRWRFSQLRFDGKFDIQYGNGSFDLSSMPVFRYQGQKPHNKNREDQRTFQVNTVRPVPFEFERHKWDDVVGIVQSDRYQLSTSAIETCANEAWNCIYPDHYHGFFNMTTLYLGAPLYFSLPHFSGSREQWVLDSFEKPEETFKPDWERYRWFLDVDFHTGLSIEGYVALQRNFALRPTDLYYPALYLCDNCSDLLVPTLYFEEQNIVFEQLLNQLYTLQFIMRFSRFSTQVTSCVISAMMIMTAIYILYKRRQGHSDWGIYDPLEDRRKAYETNVPTAMMAEFEDHLGAASHKSKDSHDGKAKARTIEDDNGDGDGDDDGDDDDDDDDDDYDDGEDPDLDMDPDLRAQPSGLEERFFDPMTDDME